MSDTVIISLGLVLLVAIVAWLLRHQIKKIVIGPTGAKIETHSPPDPTSLSVAERINAGGKRVDVEAAGKGTAVRDIVVDKTSEDISIKSSTKE